MQPMTISQTKHPDAGPASPRQPKPPWLKIRAPGGGEYAALKAQLRDVLLGMASDPEGAKLLADYRIERFVPVAVSDYAS